LIVIKVPLRISLAGGGSDFDAYSREYDGYVVSFAINKYVYVIIRERYDDLVVLNYTQHEIVSDVSEIKHEIIRACMEYAEIKKGVEISTLADIPSAGTGLGSSSAITIGLLQAMFAYQGIYVTPKELAEDACMIEIDTLDKPIGRQDQYTCAIGGFMNIYFNSSGVLSLPIPAKHYDIADNLFLHFTGITRDGNKILEEQDRDTNKNISILGKLADYARDAHDAILAMDYDKVGEIIHSSWVLKQTLATGISNGEIDRIIDIAYTGGATGCKICGAGGGGFLLSYVPPQEQYRFKEAMKNYRELPFSIDPFGARIIFNIQ
jgi:D-glycero-alpha-D-manno-heptose-7-phosphate kinase